MRTKRKRLLWILSCSVVFFSILLLWHRISYHPVFGRIYRVEIVESWSDSQLPFEKMEIRIRSFFGLKDLPPPESYGLRIGPRLFGWSLGGHIYMNNPLPPSEAVWEIALVEKRKLREVTPDDLNVEFYGMNDPRGSNVFGKAWGGHSLKVPDEQVLLIRLLTNRAETFAVQLGKTKVVNNWGENEG